MLILTRRVGETLFIGDEIKVKVLQVNGNQVRIGIDAPIDVSVHREEIYRKIQIEKNRELYDDYLVEMEYKENFNEIEVIDQERYNTENLIIESDSILNIGLN